MKKQDRKRGKWQDKAMHCGLPLIQSSMPSLSGPDISVFVLTFAPTISYLAFPLSVVVFSNQPFSYFTTVIFSISPFVWGFIFLTRVKSGLPLIPPLSFCPFRYDFVFSAFKAVWFPYLFITLRRLAFWLSVLSLLSDW